MFAIFSHKNISIMSRSISEFPKEVLQEIFKYVKGKDAVRCRLVCSGWLLAIDDLSDKAWKEYCSQDFEECLEAYKKANITWRELYKSLTLWPKLPSAKMSVKTLVGPEMGQFCVLRDRLGISQYEKTKTNGRRGQYDHSCNKIVYYDLDTLEKKTETIFDFLFYTYSENDKFIVVIEVPGKLCVIPKSTMEKVFVGTLRDCRQGVNEEYALFENSVYFANSDDFICKSKLVDVDRRSTVVTESLCELRDEIVKMTYVNENHINILAYLGEIYSLKQNKLKMVARITNYAKVSVKLKRYGFDWTWKPINEWIETYLAGEVVPENDTFWSHGDILIMGTGHRVINIYHNLDPYALITTGTQDHVKPTHSVDLNYLFESQVGHQKVHQIDAVEVPNGHKVIVLAVDKLIVLEFLHECEGRKKKADVDVSECCIKRKKTFKEGI